MVYRSNYFMSVNLVTHQTFIDHIFIHFLGFVAAKRISNTVPKGTYTT